MKKYNCIPFVKNSFSLQKLVLLIAFNGILFFNASAQNPFQASIGGTGDDVSTTTLQTIPDGGYISIGSTNTFGAGGYDMYLIKTDELGQTSWTKTFGGTGDEYGLSMQQTTDGGYILAGTTNSFGNGDYDIYLIKTNASGDTLWTKAIGGAGFDFALSVQQTGDGGYILVGNSSSFGGGVFGDIYVVKTDNTGNIAWTRTIGGTSEQYGNAVRETADGGYIVVGYSTFDPAAFYNIFLNKLSSSGVLLWSRSIGAGAPHTTSDDEASSIIQTTDKGYLMAGFSDGFSAGGALSGDWDIYLVKTDSLGVLQWSKTYGGGSEERVGIPNNIDGNYASDHALQQTVDKGYIVTGYSTSFSLSGQDVYLIKTDSSGVLQWSKGYGATGQSYGTSVQQTSPDGGYAIGGQSSSYSAGGDNDFYIIKTDINGNAGCNQLTPATYTLAINTVSYTVSPTVSSGGIAQPTPTIVGGGGQSISVCACPSLSVTPPNSTICQGASEILLVSGGNTYSWLPFSTLSSSTGASVIANPSASTTYTITETSCGNSVTTNVTVSGLAASIITASPSSVAICYGASTNITAGGGISYQWSPSTYLNSTTATSVIASPTSSITYVVTGTGANGCTNIALSNITVNTLPALSFFPSFQMAIGDVGFDLGGIAIYTADGAYIVAGRTTDTDVSGTGGHENIALTKIDGSGNHLWTKEFGGFAWEMPSSIKQTKDGGYIIAGTSNSFGGGYRIYVVKTDGSGNPLWSKICGNSGSFGSSALQTADGGYIITGGDYNFGGVAYLFKTDAVGNMLWSKGFNLTIANPTGLGFATGNCVQQTADGGYIIVGKVIKGEYGFFGDPDYDVYLVKTDASGNLQWSRSYGKTGEAGDDEGTSVQQTADGGYVVAGITDDFGAGNTDIYLLRMDNSGSLLWSKTYGGASWDQAYAVLQTPDKGFAVSGMTNNFGAGLYDACLLKTDSVGTLKWFKTYGGSGIEEGFSLQKTPDQGYLIGAATSTFGRGPNIAGGGDLYIIKTDSFGISGCHEGNASPVVTIPATVFSDPNTTVSYGGPMTDVSTIMYANDQQISVVCLSTIASPTICAGTVAHITIGGASNYSWSPSVIFSSTDGSVVSASPTVTTTYTITGSSIYGCPQSTTFKIFANPLPTLTVSPNSSICTGTITNLTAGGSAGNYFWSPGNLISSTTGPLVVFTPTTAGAYTYSVTTGADANGCVNKGISMVTVNITPTVLVTANLTMCEGIDQVLSSNGIGTLGYTWVPSTGLSSTTGSIITADPPPGIQGYTVTGTSNSGCSSDASLIITVNSQPTVFTSPNQSICSGSIATLTGGGGADTYIWYPSIGLSTTTGNIIVATLVPGIYTYTVNGAYLATQCSNSSVITINVNPMPTADAGPDQAICLLATTTITASGGSDYYWSPADYLSATTGASTACTPPGLGTYNYTVTVSNIYGCVSEDSIVITQVVSITADAGSDMTICTGTCTMLTGSGGVSYSWSPSSGLNATNIYNPNVCPLTSTSYTLTAYGGGNSTCFSTDEIMITVAFLPTVYASANATVCAGSSAMLSASGANDYLWQPSGNISPSVGSPVSASPVITTTYSVTGIDNNGCRNTATLEVVVNSLPTVDAGINQTISPGESVSLNATGNGISFFWFPATVPPSGSTVVVNPQQTTIYYVTATDENGCETSDSIVIVVRIPCGDIYIPNAFSPNADGENDVLYIKTLNNNCIRSMNFEIFDRWGNKVFSATGGPASGWETIGWDGKFNGKEYDPAVFVYNLKAKLTDGTSINKKGNISLLK